MIDLDLININSLELIDYYEEIKAFLDTLNKEIESLKVTNNE